MAPQLIPRGELLGLCGWTRELLQRETAKRVAKESNEFNIAPKWSYYSDPSLALSASDGQKRHNDLVKTLERLDLMGYRRNHHQMAMHKAYTIAALKWIYKGDLNANLVRLIRDYEIDELRSDVIVLTPRRYGKTMSVALFVAAYIMTQPDAEVAIYSTGRRASKKLLALIWKICVAIAGTTDICLGYNQEELKVKCMNGGVSTVGSFPSKEQIGAIVLARTHIRTCRAKKRFIFEACPASRRWSLRYTRG